VDLMTTPNPPSRPDQAVSKESSVNMAEALDSLTQNMAALNETMRRTAEEISATLDIQGRTGYGPDTQLAYQARQRVGQKTPEITTQALGNMRQQFGITNDLTLGMTRLDPTQASTSIGHARAYAAQRIGEAIGGTLYSSGPPPGQPTSTGSGPSRGSQGPPAGGTTSGGAPPGGGAPGGSGGPPSMPPSGTLPRSQPTPGRSPAMQALGARIATSGGQTDKLMHAAKHLPVVGLAADVAGRAGHTYLDQREKGRNYQEIEGGTNLSAQRERGHEEVYRLGMGFGMSEEASRQAFYGVTELGYNRRGDSGSIQNRQGALNFAYHNYNARGMDVGESLQVLQTASQNATVTFKGLSDALKDVSDTAGSAGVNAKQMRQQFDAVLGTAIQQGAGPGSTSLARTITSTQASYGKSFSNQSFAGQLGSTEMYMMAGQYGINPGQAQQIQRTNPQEYTRMLTGNNSRVIQSLQGMTPEAMSDLKAIIQKYGGQGTMDAQKATIVGNEWLNKWQGRNAIDLNVWSQLINQMTGLQLDNNTVMQWVVQQVSGNTEAAHAATQQSAGVAKVASDQYGNLTKGTGGADTGKTGLYQDPNTSSGGKGAGEKAHTMQSGPLRDLKDINAGHHWYGTKAANKAAEQYIGTVSKNKQRDPIMEALLQNVKDPNNTHVQVTTKSGTRVVSFADAVKYFPNELTSGNAQFVDGPQAGRGVSELTGGNVDTTRDTSGEIKSDQGGKVGTSLSDWQKKHPAKKSGATPQAVTVGLTTEAQRLLQLLPNNNNPAAASGSPPQNPYPSQASRGGN
jgi:hypothetical protein